jgi:hypothetical protein
MICAACYVGEQAPQLAHDLVLEIRTRYNLPAYVINRGEEERRRQREELKRLHERYPDSHVPLHTTRVEDQCAVLIGGYKDMETARRALKDIKKLQPSSEKLMHPWAEVFIPKKEGEEGKIVEGYMNPFLNGFVVRNPTAPLERPVENKSDHFLKDLNAHESLSVLKCKKPWTMVVATFQGLQVIQAKSQEPEGFFEKLLGKSGGDTLEASGHNARNLANALRKLNFEAYVLHTRWGSIVTIGCYDRSDDPQMGQVQRSLASLQLGQGLNLMAQPLPMEIPRP